VPSTLLSIPPNPPHDYLVTSSSCFVGPHGVADSSKNSHCHSKRSADQDQPSRSGVVDDVEEIDLELRLGPSWDHEPERKDRSIDPSIYTMVFLQIYTSIKLMSKIQST
jgi:hypothetical protein